MERAVSEAAHERPVILGPSGFEDPLLDADGISRSAFGLIEYAETGESYGFVRVIDQAWGDRQVPEALPGLVNEITELIPYFEDTPFPEDGRPDLRDYFAQPAVRKQFQPYYNRLQLAYRQAGGSLILLHLSHALQHRPDVNMSEEPAAATELLQAVTTLHGPANSAFDQARTIETEILPVIGNDKEQLYIFLGKLMAEVDVLPSRLRLEDQVFETKVDTIIAACSERVSELNFEDFVRWETLTRGVAAFGNAGAALFNESDGGHHKAGIESARKIFMWASKPVEVYFTAPDGTIDFDKLQSFFTHCDTVIRADKPPDITEHPYYDVRKNVASVMVVAHAKITTKHERGVLLTQRRQNMHACGLRPEADPLLRLYALAFDDLIEAT